MSTQTTETVQQVILDLGCGTKKQPNTIGIDFVKSEGIDIVQNLDLPNLHLHYKDSSVDGIYAIHFLEHIHHLFPLLNECHRILKAVGFMDIVVPMAPSRAAFDDPTHVRFFTKGTFSYFTPQPPGNYSNPQLTGFWRIEKNDWTPKYKEDVDTIYESEMQELHVIMRPIKAP